MGWCSFLHQPDAHGSRPHTPATGLATEESSTSHDDDFDQLVQPIALKNDAGLAQ